MDTHRSYYIDRKKNRNKKFVIINMVSCWYLISCIYKRNVLKMLISVLLRTECI